MAISAAAKSNHDQLFGDRVSTLAQSDPELIEYFDNFAFGEVHTDAARLDETLDLHTGSWFSWPRSWPPAGLQSSASWPPQWWPTAG